MPTEEEIQKIIELYDNGNGLSQGQIADEMGRSKSTINKWLHKILDGESFANEEEQKKNQTKNATAAKRTYDRERRLELNNLFFEKIETMLKDATDPNVVRTLAIPYGVACDKRAALEPNEGSKTGLEEMREAIRKERNGMATSSGKLQSG